MDARSSLELGVLATFAALGFAAVVGLIAVFDSESEASAFGTGFGIALLVFLAGATIVCALACLARGRAPLVSLGSIAAAGIATDLLVLAVWLEIDDETYGKTAAVAFVWSLFALIALGLTLAIGPLGRLGRVLYWAAIGMAAVSALLSTWLIATAGSSGEIFDLGFGLTPSDATDNEVLRLLGAALVLLAALWFSALAASRLDQSRSSPS